MHNATGAVPAATVEVVLHALEAVGFDVRQCVPSGLDVSASSYARLWREAVAQGLEPHHVLEAARHYLVGTLAPIDIEVFSAPTIGAALERLAESWTALSGEEEALVLHRAPATLRVRWLGAREAYLDQLDGLLALAAIYDRLRAHAARAASLRPALVRLTLAAPRARAPFEAFFGCEVAFAAGYDELHLPLACTRVRLRTAKVTPAARSKRRTPAVQAAIEHTLHLGASLEDVADAIEVHPRTLQRQLERAGTTLRVVRHRAQMAQARQWLAQSDTPIHEVARRVGFDDAAAFARAFGRRHGVSPREWRVHFRRRDERGII